MHMLHNDHPNYMLNSWMDVLLDFDFKTHHCPGISNVIPDCLSRQYGICASFADPLGYHAELLDREGVGPDENRSELFPQSRQERRVAARKRFVPVKNKKRKVALPEALSQIVEEEPSDPEDTTVDDYFDNNIQSFDGSKISKLTKPMRLNEWISRPDIEIAELVRDRLLKEVPPVEQRERMLDECHERLGHRGAEFMYKHLWIHA